MNVGELLDEIADLDVDDTVVVVVSDIGEADKVYQLDKVIKTVDEVALQVKPVEGSE